MNLYDIIGIIGVVAAVVAYFFVLRGSMKGDGIWFPVINILACIGVILSLSVNFNLPAFLVEVSFLGVSIYGVYHYFKSKRDEKT